MCIRDSHQVEQLAAGAEYLAGLRDAVLHAAGARRPEQAVVDVHLQAVSYTHLDVYKRQLVDWSPINAASDLYLLRASIPLAGRAFPVYESVHDREGTTRLPSLQATYLICIRNTANRRDGPSV